MRDWVWSPSSNTETSHAATNVQCRWVFWPGRREDLVRAIEVGAAVNPSCIE